VRIEQSVEQPALQVVLEQPAKAANRIDVRVRTWGALTLASEILSSPLTSSLRWRRSLLGRNSERDADVGSFLTRRTRCSFQSVGDLCERFFASQAFEQPKVVFRPWAPRRSFLIPCWSLGHDCSLTRVLRSQIYIDSIF
jgi:hypothetical protein